MSVSRKNSDTSKYMIYGPSANDTNLQHRIVGDNLPNPNQSRIDRGRMGKSLHIRNKSYGPGYVGKYDHLKQPSN